MEYKARSDEMTWKTRAEAELEGPIGEFAMITVLAVQRITGHWIFQENTPIQSRAAENSSALKSKGCC